MPGRPRRYSDRAREILFERVLERGESVGAACAAVLKATGEDPNRRSAAALVQRERSRREQATRDAGFGADPVQAVEDLAAQLFGVAARIVTREARRSSPDLVRLQRAARIVRELRPLVDPLPKRAAKTTAAGGVNGNGHEPEESGDAARLAAALAARAS